MLTHELGSLREETHYYPFGLTMAGMSSKAIAKMDNKYKFNGIEQSNEFDINMYDVFYRNFDPQLGRFWQIDTKPNDMISPYAGMANNPVRYSDPLGDTVALFRPDGTFWKSHDDGKKEWSGTIYFPITDMISKKNLPAIIIFFVITVVVVFMSYFQRQKLLNNAIVIRGTVVEIKTFRNSGGRYFAKFTCNTDQGILHGMTSFGCDGAGKKEITNILVGKKLYAVFQKDNYSNSRLLLTEKEYRDRGLDISAEDSIVLQSLSALCTNN